MKIRAILLGLCIGFGGSVAIAEDIDIYNANPALTGQRPNILIVLANQASWNAQFNYEKQALQEVFSSLDANFNVGMSLFSQSEHGYCSASDDPGGFVRFGIRQMTGTNSAALAAVVNGLHVTNDSGNNATYGLAMYEAFNYFRGGPAWSGETCIRRDYPGNAQNPESMSLLSGHAFSSSTAATYTSPINATNNCAGNYIIFISNGPATDSNTGQNSTAAGTKLVESGGNNGLIGLNPSAAQDNKGDEWARFLSSTDVAPSVAGKQSIVTYTIDVNPGATNQGVAHTALLQSMASHGKGRYFAASDMESLKQALQSIFNEIQSVDSTFASVTLPVTVGVRGSYLNQIYMGVFRPDADAAPRWPGNLKQYRIAYIGGVATLTDRDATAPLEDADGFVRESAKSYWTHDSNFWSFRAGPDFTASDLPDGGVVEKGGAAQRLRDVYATSQTARKVLTCVACFSVSPSGTPEVFDTTNTSITAAALGLTDSVAISTAVRSGATVTVTTAAAHNLTTGQTARVSGMQPTGYNGYFSPTVTATNSLTYTVAVTPATPDPSAMATDTGVKMMPAIPLVSMTNTNSSGNRLITLTLGQPHGLTAGTTTTATMTGMSNSFFNKTVTVMAGVDPSVISYIDSTASNSALATSGYVGLSSQEIGVTNLVRDNPVSGTTAIATATLASGTFAVGANVVVKGASGTEYNGLFSISAASGSAVSYSINTGPGVMTTAGTIQAGSGTRTEVINWVRGQDNVSPPSGGEDNDGLTTDVRASAHGDIVHSRPAVINFGGTPSNPADLNTQRNIAVFYGGNDGMLHAVKGGRQTTTDGSGADGYELWSFIFPEHFNKLDRLRANYPVISETHRKPYFVDGSIGAYVKDNNGNDRLGDSSDIARIFVTMRRGGRFLYAFDVNNVLAASGNNPMVLWKISPTTVDASASMPFAELGQTWSEPKSGIIKIGTDPNFTYPQIVVFGGGYDPDYDDSSAPIARTMGRAVFIVNGATGALIKRFDSSNIPSMTASIPADVNLVDSNKDGYADRLYVADTNGQIFRIDIGSADPSQWRGYRIANLGGTGANARRFLFMPDVILGTTFDSILIGSGNREKPFDTTINDRFYMLMDKHEWTVDADADGVLDADADGVPDAAVITEADLLTAGQVDAAGNLIPLNLSAVGVRGWKLNLQAGERVVGGATSAFNVVYFVTNIPPTYTDADLLECKSNLGTARLYAVSYLNALPALFTVSGSPSYYTEVAGGGLLPTPVLAQVRDDDGKVATVVISGSASAQVGAAGKKTNRWWNRAID